jgi:hypothetical protein
MKTYKGGCHCGAVQYEVDMDPHEGLVCNCSHCSKKGFVLTFVKPEQFRLVSGLEMLTEYRFNTKRIGHLFCRICGVQSFSRGTGKDGSEMIAVNLRCVQDLDLDALPKQHYNGKDM